jgi:hypothetical protein
VINLNHNLLQYVTKGVDSITPDAVESIKEFLATQLATDGGFLGRDGKSDLYYTVFGIQLIHALNLTPEKKLSICNALAPFVVPAEAGTTNDKVSIVMRTDTSLSNFLQKIGDVAGLDFVHLASLIRCHALLQIETTSNFQLMVAQIESFRSSDGGYSHLDINAESGTVYAGFLAYLAYYEGGLAMPDSDKLIQSLEHLKMKDGSYANDSGMESGSTTATSAAVILLNAFGKKVENITINALLSRAQPDGGFLAGASSPVPDLLSTATALFALKALDYDISGEQSAHREFIVSLWNEDGGFSGHIFDDTSDCEYSLYALLALGLLPG